MNWHRAFHKRIHDDVIVPFKKTNFFLKKKAIFKKMLHGTFIREIQKTFGQRKKNVLGKKFKTDLSALESLS